MNESELDMKELLVDAIRCGATAWFEHLYKVTNPDEQTSEDVLHILVGATQTLLTDVKLGVKHYDQLFDL